jgi:RNA polymerase sigma-70 factor, ECF subfamily
MNLNNKDHQDDDGDLGSRREPERDASLAARAILGDRDAFAELVVPLLPRALVLARRVVQNHDDAEELVNDAVLRAIERVGQYDRNRPFAPWFFRVLLNLAHTRREALAIRSHEQFDELAATAPESHRTDAAERAEFQSAFAAALDALPARQRSIVMLYDVDGYTGAEIAEHLAISAETVRWHLHAARQTLRVVLARFRT